MQWQQGSAFMSVFCFFPIMSRHDLNAWEFCQAAEIEPCASACVWISPEGGVMFLHHDCLSKGNFQGWNDSSFASGFSRSISMMLNDPRPIWHINRHILEDSKPKACLMRLWRNCPTEPCTIVALKVLPLEPKTSTNDATFFLMAPFGISTCESGKGDNMVDKTTGRFLGMFWRPAVLEALAPSFQAIAIAWQQTSRT